MGKRIGEEAMETHIASRKEHRCDKCGRRVPIGARYFFDNGLVEHYNCLDFEDQPILDVGFRYAKRKGVSK